VRSLYICVSSQYPLSDLCSIDDKSGFKRAAQSRPMQPGLEPGVFSKEVVFQASCHVQTSATATIVPASLVEPVSSRVVRAWNGQPPLIMLPPATSEFQTDLPGPGTGNVLRPHL
jgi:hypothetical protein